MTGKAVREALGLIGIVGSLIFVGLEIRQNTVAARAAAYQNMGTGIVGVWLTAAEDPALAHMTLRYFQGSAMDDLTPQDSAQLVVQAIAAMRQYEVTWRQVKLGLLPGEALDYFGFARDPVPNDWMWERVLPYMSPDFRAFLMDPSAP